MSTVEDNTSESFAKDLDVTMEGQKSSGKVFRLAEVSKHDSAEDMWMVIHNKVYDVTNFLEEHPGGVEVLLENAGLESTYAFEDVGHSLDARDLLAQYYVGDVHEDDATEKGATPDDDDKGGSSSGLLLGLVVAVLAAAAFFMFGNRN